MTNHAEKLLLSKEDMKMFSKEHWHCLEMGGSCSTECSLKTLFNIFGQSHVLEIIRVLLLHETLRFNEIAELVPSSPKTLTKRLQTLVKFSLINRVPYNEIPPRVEYSLTKPGTELEQVFREISKWLKTWKESIFSIQVKPDA